MDALTTLASILAVLFIGVISPGPSFVLVAHKAIGNSRAAGVASALGMAAGACVLCIVAQPSARPLQTHLQAKTAIDRATGAVLGRLGVKLLP